MPCIKIQSSASLVAEHSFTLAANPLLCPFSFLKPCSVSKPILDDVAHAGLICYKETSCMRFL